MATIPIDYFTSLAPSGTVVAHAATSAPNGWLLCDGSAISRTTYASLFASIGTTYGVGNGSTTFNLPDYRGMFLRGAGTNGTHAKAAGGNFAGGAAGTFDADKIQGFRIGSNASSRLMDRDSYPPAPNLVSRSGVYTENIGGNNSYMGPQTDSTNGTPRTGNETKPASYSIYYIIKH